MKKIFVVSCQALEDEPLYGKGIQTKMAKAALIGGADWIRTSQLHNIIDIKKEINVPIIGIIKKDYDNSDVRITATLKELKDLVETKVDIIAIDATTRKRPKETLDELVRWFRKNKYDGQKLMADCSNIDDIKNAINLKFDFIGTTLRGYTSDTKGSGTKENDFSIIKEAKVLTNIPIVAEGGIETPEEARRAFEIGANIVVVGGAITRPRTIVQRFVNEIKGEKHDKNI